MEAALATRAEKVAERARSIRRRLITVFYRGRGGHFGGCLSVVDLLAALYFDTMRYDPKNPKWPERDRFVLSKGHASVALDCTLAEAGFFPEDWLETYTQLYSPISQHPDMHRTPGAEVSMGSLGHGIGVASGMALAARLDGKRHRVYCLIADGETDEGKAERHTQLVGQGIQGKITTIGQHGPGSRNTSV